MLEAILHPPSETDGSVWAGAVDLSVIPEGPAAAAAAAGASTDQILAALQAAGVLVDAA